MKLSNVFSQALRWPPSVTTVIGVGMLVGLASYEVTGSFEFAVALAGVFKILCPQDSAAVDQAEADAEVLVSHFPQKVP